VIGGFAFAEQTCWFRGYMLPVMPRFRHSLGQNFPVLKDGIQSRVTPAHFRNRVLATEGAATPGP